VGGSDVTEPYRHRGVVTFAVMMATLMNTLDSTIASVALPHIQGSLSAAPDEIGWVLTSYIVAGAMVTPASGWISNRLGYKNTLLFSLIGFTVASMLCGVASNLPELVMFRMVQGAFGAFSVPLSQAVLLDVNPPERHAQAMATWAMGTLIGPIFGPVIGGYLTEQASWRWCFYINLPLGALTIALIWLFMGSDRQHQKRRFDALGFATLITTVACVQLVIDRGPGRDWFSSSEIWAEALIGLAAFWVFVVHTMTTRNPFIDPSLLRDRNLVGSTVFGFFGSALIFGSLVLMPIFMQTLLGFPVLTAGVISIPRGLGSLVSMALLPHLASRFGMRSLLLTGLFLTGVSYWQAMQFDLTVGAGPLIVAGVFQGLGQGLFFVPMTALAFATVPPEQRAEASSLFNVIRTLGTSVGISTMQALIVRNSQVAHASLTAGVTPSDPVVHAALSGGLGSGGGAGLQALEQEISRQANMIAYLDDFRALFLLTVICVPMVFLLQENRRKAADVVHVAAD